MTLPARPAHTSGLGFLRVGTGSAAVLLGGSVCGASMGGGLAAAVIAAAVQLSADGEGLCPARALAKVTCSRFPGRLVLGVHAAVLVVV